MAGVGENNDGKVLESVNRARPGDDPDRAALFGSIAEHKVSKDEEDKVCD